MVYSNFTPRKSRNGQDRFVFFGLQAFLNQLVQTFDETFFNWTKGDVVNDFAFFYKQYFGVEPPDDLISKVEYLHDLQYLPLEVRALPEGAVVKHVTLVVFPDKSAQKRFERFVPNSIPTVTCGKQRNAEGDIMLHNVPDIYSIPGRVLVLDDLCDGGATFISVAKLSGIPRERLSLYTVHGLYTKGTDELLTYYNQVICSSSCNSLPRHGANVYPDDSMEWY
jgi:hypothetical protein